MPKDYSGKFKKAPPFIFQGTTSFRSQQPKFNLGSYGIKRVTDRETYMAGSVAQSLVSGSGSGGGCEFVDLSEEGGYHSEFGSISSGGSKRDRLIKWKRGSVKIHSKETALVGYLDGLFGEMPNVRNILFEFWVSQVARSGR